MEPHPSKKKRRVSDSQRKRVLISCDRCKKRKIRCIRISGNDDACAACAQLSLTCESTLPRKQRLYASYDQLQLRYRALDFLVRRLYPTDNIETIEDICSLARRHAIDMSTFEEEVNEVDPVLTSEEVDGSPFDSPRHTFEEATLFDSVRKLNIPEGALIPAPHGGYHYVGPASSYLFANTIRRLVKKFGTHPASDRRGRRRLQQANEFTSADRTTALEARIPGHPVMLADTDNDSPATSDGFQAKEQSDTGTHPSPQDRTTPRSVLGSSSVNRRINEILPPRPLANRLVDAFFERVHINFTLFHRGTFKMQYDTLWSPSGQSREPGWICVFYMVLVLGAQALERDHLSEAAAIQKRYLAIVVREGLQRLVLTATLANVHALALLGLYQHNAGERNTSWMLIGHASRMGIALGIQRDGENANFDYITHNSRRATWWTLSLFEQNLSFILGRPSATSTIDVSACLPDEGVIDGYDAPSRYLEHAVKLGDISAQIKRFIASISTQYTDATFLAETTAMATHLARVLANWERTLPPQLQSRGPFALPTHRRAVQLLHATYNHLRSVLGRPYLLCRIDHELDNRLIPLPVAIAEMSQLSLSAARDCMVVLAELASFDGIEGELWYDYYYVHHASLILSLPFLVDPNNSSADRAMISTALNLAKQSRLAPTYRILINVSIQFAKIVGISPDDDPSRPSSPRRPALDELPQARNDAMEDLISQWSLDASIQQGAFADSSPVLPQFQGTVNAFSSNDHTWSMLPIFNEIPESQPFSLEQLLNMQAPSLLPENTMDFQRHGDVSFSDMFNFGFEAPALPVQTSNSTRRSEGLTGQEGVPTDVSWDFFGGIDTYEPARRDPR